MLDTNCKQCLGMLTFSEATEQMPIWLSATRFFFVPVLVLKENRENLYVLEFQVQWTVKSITTRNTSLATHGNHYDLNVHS